MRRHYFEGVVFMMKENHDLFCVELESHTATMEAWWLSWTLLLSLSLSPGVFMRQILVHGLGWP